MTRRSPFAGLSPASFAFKGRPRLTARPSLFVEGFLRLGFAPTHVSRVRERSEAAVLSSLRVIARHEAIQKTSIPMQNSAPLLLASINCRLMVWATSFVYYSVTPRLLRRASSQISDSTTQSESMTRSGSPARSDAYAKRQPGAKRGQSPVYWIAALRLQ